MREKAIHMRRVPISLKGGEWTYETTEAEVRVMARVEGYAMVRHKGAMPFVVSEKELRPVNGRAE